MINELFKSVVEDVVSTLSETINRIQNAFLKEKTGRQWWMPKGK